MAPPTESPAERFTVSPRTVHVLAIVALVLLCTIVVTGAAVRLTGSGLGCSDWPNCSPDRFVSVENPNQAIEQVNRLFTGLVSVSVIAAVLGSLRRRPFRRDLVWLSLGLVAGVIGQAVLGGITVLVDLHPVAVAGHFVLSMVLVADATVLVWRSARPGGPRRAVVDPVTVTMARLAAVSGALLMITGPIVTGTGPHGGDLAAPRFGWFLPDVTRIHSLNMWLFLACTVTVLVRLARIGAPVGVQRRGSALLAAIVAQGVIGYVQYALEIPAWIVILHIIGATTVFGLTVWFLLGLFEPVAHHEEMSGDDRATAGGRGADDPVTSSA
jgi:heme a synthase